MVYKSHICNWFFSLLPWLLWDEVLFKNCVSISASLLMHILYNFLCGICLFLLNLMGASCMTDISILLWHMLWMCPLIIEFTCFPQYPLTLHIIQNKNQSVITVTSMTLHNRASCYLFDLIYFSFPPLGLLGPRYPDLLAVIENEKHAASSGPLHFLCPLPGHKCIDSSMIWYLIFFRCSIITLWVSSLHTL